MFPYQKWLKTYNVMYPMKNHSFKACWNFTLFMMNKMMLRLNLFIWFHKQKSFFFVFFENLGRLVFRKLTSWTKWIELNLVLVWKTKELACIIEILWKLHELFFKLAFLLNFYFNQTWDHLILTVYFPPWSVRILLLINCIIMNICINKRYEPFREQHLQKSFIYVILE